MGAFAPSEYSYGDSTSTLGVGSAITGISSLASTLVQVGGAFGIQRQQVQAQAASDARQAELLTAQAQTAAAQTRAERAAYKVMELGTQKTVYIVGTVLLISGLGAALWLMSRREVADEEIEYDDL